MKTLDERLRNVDQIDATELWPEIEDRSSRTPSIEDALHRALTMAVALVIGLGVIGAFVVVFALRSMTSRTPNTPNTPVTTPPGVANGLIAVSGGPFGGPQILVMDPTGSQPIAITGGGADEGTPEHPNPASSPAWSPDGSRIAFQGLWGHGEQTDIFVVNADGSGIRQLTTTGAEQPSWSPDGTEIAFGTWNGIYIIGADGTGLHRLTPESSLWHDNPSWAPDGSRVAFSTPINGTYQVFSIAADGTDVRQLTDLNDGADSPSWSPDGSEIAFVRQDPSGPPDIFVMNPDGTGSRPITACDPPVCSGDNNPAWSPDGSLLLLGRSQSSTTDIYSVRPDGSDLTLVAENAFDAAWQAIPAGSPTLSTIALPHGDRARRLTISDGDLWALASMQPTDPASVLLRIDTATARVVASIPLAGEPFELAAGGGSVWVGSPRSNELQRVEIASGSAIAPVQLPGRGVDAIAADDESVWIEVIDSPDQGSIRDQASLVRVDARTGAVVATIPLEGFSGYDDEISIGADAVWVAGVNLAGANEERSAGLIRIDPGTNTIADRIPTVAFSVRAGVGAVWITSPADGVNDSLRKPESWVAQEVDPVTGQVSAPIALPGNVSAVLAVTDDGIWFSGYDEQGYIHPVKLQGGSFDSAVPGIGSAYSDILFDDVSNTIWIAAISGLERVNLG